MAAVEAMTQTGDVLVSAFPNAGLPAYVDGRYIFGAPLPYLTDCGERMVEQGVNLLGGCCGTTPEYVRRIAERLAGRKPSPRVCVAAERPAVATGGSPVGLLATTGEPPVATGSILERYAEEPMTARLRPRPLVIVELDPPKVLRYEPVGLRGHHLRALG